MEKGVYQCTLPAAYYTISMDRGVHQCILPAATVNGERSLPVHFTSCILRTLSAPVHFTCCTLCTLTAWTEYIPMNSEWRKGSTSALYLLHIMYTISMDRVYTHEQWNLHIIYTLIMSRLHEPIEGYGNSNSEWRNIYTSAWTEYILNTVKSLYHIYSHHG